MNGERSKHQKLKVLKFRMSNVQCLSDHNVDLVIYILNNCVALREVVIGSRGSFRGAPITAEMRAAANHLRRKLQGKVVANHIQLEFFGCDVAMQSPF